MKFVGVILSLGLSFATLSTSAAVPAFTGEGSPIKFISSCELDLNKDGQADLVFLIESLAGRELIVNLREDFIKFKAYSLFRAPPGNGMHLSCELNVNEVKETSSSAGNRPGKVHKTNGAVIRLRKPEASETVFYWQKNEFKQVTTID